MVKTADSDIESLTPEQIAKLLYLTPEHVAKLLQVKLSTVYSWTHKGMIPYLKVGRLVRFPRRELEQWLQTKKKALAEVQ